MPTTLDGYNTGEILFDYEMEKTKPEQLVKRARKALGMNGHSQQELVRKVRRALGVTNEELAEALGKSLALVMGWLAPEGAKRHRKMTDSDKLVLREILSAKKGRA